MNDGYDNHDCYQPRYCWRCSSELDKQGRCLACDIERAQHEGETRKEAKQDERETDSI